MLLAPSPLLTHIIDPAVPGMAVLWDAIVSGADEHSCLTPIMPVQWQSVQQLLRCKESAVERTVALQWMGRPVGALLQKAGSKRRLWNVAMPESVVAVSMTAQDQTQLSVLSQAHRLPQI